MAEDGITHNCISYMTKRELELFVQGVGDRNMTNAVRINIHVYVQIVEPKTSEKKHED